MKPTFKKTSVATFTFDRAEDLDDVEQYLPAQSIGVAVGGTSKIKTYTATLEHLFLLNFRFTSRGSFANLKNFFNDSLVNWQASTFTYTDSEGNQFTVRLLQDGITKKRIPGSNMFQVSMTLRDES